MLDRLVYLFARVLLVLAFLTDIAFLLYCFFFLFEVTEIGNMLHLLVDIVVLGVLQCLVFVFNRLSERLQDYYFEGYYY